MQEFDYEIQYIKGKTNILADSLSRKPKEVYRKSTEFIKTLMALTTVELNNDITDKLQTEYVQDEFFKTHFESPIEPYRKSEGKLYLNYKLCLPEGNVSTMILHDNHKSLYGAHRGVRKLLT